MKKKGKIEKKSAFPKVATFRGGFLNGGMQKIASGNVSSTTTQFYTPELTNDAWLLPKSRLEVCFVPGTVVYTDYTIKNIEDVCSKEIMLGKESTSVVVGETYERDYEGDILEIKPYLLPKIECTPEHPILAVRSNRCSWNGKFLCKPSCLVQKSGCRKLYKDYKLEWLKAEELQENDFVVFPKYKIYEQERIFDLSKYVATVDRYVIDDKIIKYNSSDNILNRYISYSDELFTIFGWYIAEGSCGNGISFALHEDELYIAELLNKYVQKVFGLTGIIIRKNNSKGIVLSFNSLILARFFDDIFGRGAGNKRIPEFIIKANNNYIKSFLLGWIGGDGYLNIKDGRIQLSTASKEMAHQCVLLCSKLGFLPSLNINGKKGDKKIIKGINSQFNYDHYVLHITQDGLRALGIEIDRREHNKAYYSDEVYFYIPVKRINRKKYCGKVYNFSTSNETYITSFVVHNCKWIRIYFNLDPYIHSIITMHSMYPFSPFFLECKDSKVLKIFNEAMFHEDIDWYDTILQVSLSYNKFGEGILWGNWNTKLGRWDSFTCLDPDIVEVKTDPFTGDSSIELIPTVEIKKMVRDAMLEGSSNIPEVVIDNVLHNRRIPLDTKGVPVGDPYRDYEPSKVFMFIRKTDPGASRGTSVIQPLMKVMIYQDKIRMAQIAIADRHHLPIELWTVGHLTGDMNTSFLPTEDDLNNIRDMISQATASPPFSIVYSPLLKYEALGVSGKLLSVYEDLGYVENQILVGLGVNKDLILGGGACIDEKSRIMTRTGLKDIDTISENDEVLTFNPDTETHEYNRPTEIFKYDYEGHLLHFKNKSLDHMVTPNHRCWVKQCGNNDWEFIEARDVKTGFIVLDGNKNEVVIEGIDVIEYKGRVWCVNVPNHIFMCERNGKFVLTGNSFSNSKTLALHRLIMQYQTTRDLMTNWLKKNILLPIAKAHSLKDSDGNYIVPDIKWEKSLKPEQEKEVFDMFYKLWKDGVVSTKTLYTKIPVKVDYDNEKQQLEDEKNTIFDKKDKRLPQKGTTPTKPSGITSTPELPKLDDAGEKPSIEQTTVNDILSGGTVV